MLEFFWGQICYFFGQTCRARSRAHPEPRSTPPAPCRRAAPLQGVLKTQTAPCLARPQCTYALYTTQATQCHHQAGRGHRPPRRTRGFASQPTAGRLGPPGPRPGPKQAPCGGQTARQAVTTLSHAIPLGPAHPAVTPAHAHIALSCPACSGVRGTPCGRAVACVRVCVCVPAHAGGSRCAPAVTTSTHAGDPPHVCHCVYIHVHTASLQSAFGLWRGT